MKKTFLRKAAALVLALTLTVGVFAGCSKKDDNATTSTPGASTEGTSSADTSKTLDPMDVKLFLWGDKPNQMDDILAEFSKLTKDTLNMNLSINWTPQADYPNNIKLKLSAGEDVDMCFDAPWMNMNTFIAQGNYRDLTSYFNNDEYPGLKEAFNQEYLSNNLMGAEGDKVYGLPLTQSFGGSGLVYIRGDLREKYGAEPVTDLTSFEAYLEAIAKNEKSMIPFAMKKDGSYGLNGIIDQQNPEKAIAQIEAGLWAVEIAPGITATCYIKDYELIDCVLSGEPASAKVNLPAPFNTTNIEPQKAVRQWYEKGYIEKDVVTRDDAQSAFTSGKAASFMWDAAQYNSVVSAITAAVPDSKLECWEYDPLGEQDIKGMKKGSYQAWNFICIPVTVKDEKADRIMKFFDWMFTNSENHDLFELGIEGKNFVAVGDNEYTYPEGLDLTTNYNFPGYLLSWNPNFIRYQQGYPENVLHCIVNTNNPESYYDPMVSGFRFNGDAVKNQLANPDFLTIKARTDNLTLGIFPDVDGEAAAIDKAVIGNKILQEDIAAIKAEITAQIKPYLEARKASDAAKGTKYPTVAELKAQLK